MPKVELDLEYVKMLYGFLEIIGVRSSQWEEIKNIIANAEQAAPEELKNND